MDYGALSIYVFNAIAAAVAAMAFPLLFSRSLDLS